MDEKNPGVSATFSDLTPITQVIAQMVQRAGRREDEIAAVFDMGDAFVVPVGVTYPKYESLIVLFTDCTCIQITLDSSSLREYLDLLKRVGAEKDKSP